MCIAVCFSSSVLLGRALALALLFRSGLIGTSIVPAPFLADCRPAGLPLDELCCFCARVAPNAPRGLIFRSGRAAVCCGWQLDEEFSSWVVESREHDR